MGDISLSFLELAFGLLARLGGHLGGLDLLFDFFEVGALFTLAEFLLDRLDLLVEVEVALVLFHLPLHTAADLLVHIEDVDLAFELLVQVFQARLDVGQIQHQLFVVELQRQMRRNRVGQAARIVDAGDGRQDFRVESSC
jgi:hypothetical protein